MNELEAFFYNHLATTGNESAKLFVQSQEVRDRYFTDVPSSTTLKRQVQDVFANTYLQINPTCCPLDNKTLTQFLACGLQINSENLEWFQEATQYNQYTSAFSTKLKEKCIAGLLMSKEPQSDMPLELLKTNEVQAVWDLCIHAGERPEMAGTVSGATSIILGRVPVTGLMLESCASKFCSLSTQWKASSIQVGTLRNICDTAILTAEPHAISKLPLATVTNLIALLPQSRKAFEKLISTQSKSNCAQLFQRWATQSLLGVRILQEKWSPQEKTEIYPSCTKSIANVLERVIVGDIAKELKTEILKDVFAVVSPSETLVKIIDQNVKISPKGLELLGNYAAKERLNNPETAPKEIDLF